MTIEEKLKSEQEEIHTVQGVLNYEIELSKTQCRAKYHNDLANQTVCFIVVKNVIEKLLVDRDKDPAFKKEKPFFRKMSYQLSEFIGGQSHVLVERIEAQMALDKIKEAASRMDLKIVSNANDAKKLMYGKDK